MKFGGGNGPLDMEIVGVVKDSHHGDAKEKPRPFVYVPYPQEKNLGALTYYVRTTSDPLVLANSVRQAVAELDGSIPVYDLRTFENQIDRKLSGDKLVAVLALAFGSLAGLLVAPTSAFGPYYMNLILVYGFTAAVIGGLESPVGALVGGLITGLCISYVGGYLGSGVEPAGALVLLIAALMVRPEGIFSRPPARRV